MKHVLFCAAGLVLTLGCAGAPVEVVRPADLKQNRFVRLEPVRSEFTIAESSAFKFFYGRGGRRKRNRDEKLRAASASLEPFVRRSLEYRLASSGLAPLSGGSAARPAGLVFRGAYRLTVESGLFYDSAEVVFQGDLLSGSGGAPVAHGVVRDRFKIDSGHGFEEILNDSADRAIRIWFETLERAY